MIIKHTNPKQDRVLKLWFSAKQDYNFAANLESRRKIIHFQKKWNLKRSPDELVRSLWSCKKQDYPGTVVKNWDFWINHVPKLETNYTTEKFRIFYPKSKKIAPDLESGWPSYGLSKLDCQFENQFGEGLHQQTAMLNLTSKWPSQ